MFVITAGRFKNRALHLPPQNLTRPTSSRAREALFNILRHRYHRPDGQDFLKNGLILDLYAGSGCIGLEALSRGARFVVFCEKHPDVLPVLRSNIALLAQDTFTRILKISPPDLTLKDWTFKEPPSLIFMDPPFEKKLIPQTLLNPLITQFYKEGSLIICESSVEEKNSKSFFDASGTPYTLDLERHYGKARFSFLKCPGPRIS